MKFAVGIDSADIDFSQMPLPANFGKTILTQKEQAELAEVLKKRVAAVKAWVETLSYEESQTFNIEV